MTSVRSHAHVTHHKTAAKTHVASHPKKAAEGVPGDVKIGPLKPLVKKHAHVHGGGPTAAAASKAPAVSAASAEPVKAAAASAEPVVAAATGASTLGTTPTSLEAALQELTRIIQQMTALLGSSAPMKMAPMKMETTAPPVVAPSVAAPPVVSAPPVVASPSVDAPPVTASVDSSADLMPTLAVGEGAGDVPPPPAA
jgi:hypothetical protein